MRVRARLSIVSALALVAAGLSIPAAQATAGCQPTGYLRDGKNLTAAQIGGAVHGELEATGCDIGLYVDADHPGKVAGADISGAKYFGVVNNGQQGLAITGSQIHQIGDQPFSGAQHGVAIYFVYGSRSTGKISGNVISEYQKGGIAVNGSGSQATIVGNTVTGLGPVGFIAQNGIQIGWGATGVIENNAVSGNSYTGTGWQSGGIILVGGAYYGGDYVTGVQITGNRVAGNDIGVWLSNVPADYTQTPDVPTNNVVSHNAISNGSIVNDYQAGIAAQGNGDTLTDNRISGTGYTPVSGDSPYLRYIDALDVDLHASHNRCTSGPGQQQPCQVPAP